MMREICEEERIEPIKRHVEGGRSAEIYRSLGKALQHIEWVRGMTNFAYMQSLEPLCPGATRRGVAPTPIRGWGTSQCRGLGAAVLN